MITPLIQASVRNGFTRINETSFYREDLRNALALPLKDWSLPFKPQLWAYFAISPARALSIYYALYMVAFHAGDYFLFGEMGMPAWLACGGALLAYFSGYTQFWWTTLGPLLAGLPWILLIVLRPMAWWKKALVCIWAFPAFIFGYVYPAVLLTLIWGTLIVIAALRPSLLRSPGTIAAVAIGAIAAAVVLFVYYGDVIRIMRNTVYPGQRVAPPGGTPIPAVLSQVFPFLSFRLRDYQQIEGENICEIGALGSFLPLLTLCLMRYRALRAVRNSLLVLGAGFIAITLWQLAPVPAWIGRILLWDKGGSQRWLFITGFLLTLGALSIWSKQLISVHPFRIFLFVLLGPVASLVVKFGWLIHRGQSSEAVISENLRDIMLSGIAVAAGLAAWYVPVASRAGLLLFTVVILNVYAFGRFNPLQPSEPIFQVPETDMVVHFREKAAASPGGVLVDLQSLGATFNGIGFRSVPHLLLTPQLALFRSYFPAMNEERFNFLFNRYGHIHLTLDPVPDSPQRDVLNLPIEVFVPVRNVRQVIVGPAQRDVCAQPAEGRVDQVLAQGDSLTISGWAPWKSETGDQGIRVLSARTLHAGNVSTIQRPDVGELLQDYGFVKAGFQVQVTSADGKAIRPEEVVLVAFGTARGDARLSCCGCPSGM